MWGMKMRKLLLLAATAALILPGVASAQAIIDNGTVQLGITDGGALNYAGVGLKSVTTGNESTFPGCTCEGWGAAVAGSTSTVYNNTSVGSDYTPVSFAFTASTATSTVDSSDGALRVTHAYTPAGATPYLYQVDVTITNTSGVDFTGDTLYRRTMDWDVEPTPFNEFSTIQGTAGAANVLEADNNGFCDSNPLSGSCGGTPAPFYHLGPTDHGASFTFGFEPLLAGMSRTLTIYYGVAPTERAALVALGSVGAEIYSFGQSNDGGSAAAETFIFGFKGVGGTSVGVPEAGTWALMILGFGFAGSMLRSQRRRVAA